jgi:hypothetical protein
VPQLKKGACGIRSLVLREWLGKLDLISGWIRNAEIASSPRPMNDPLRNVSATSPEFGIQVIQAICKNVKSNGRSLSACVFKQMKRDVAFNDGIAVKFGRHLHDELKT